MLKNHPISAWFISVALTLSMAVAVAAADSTTASGTNQFLDPTFGTNGVHRIRYESDRGSTIRDLVVQSDGKLVVAVDEACFVACSYGFVAVRHNPDGSLDHSFNGTGRVRTPVGDGLAAAEAVVVQSDGKILVVGTAEDAQYDNVIGLVRYNPNATLDNTFGNNGVVITDIANSDDLPRDIVVQSDGKIIVAGLSRVATGNGTERRWLVVRYDTTGTPDPQFATNGVFHPSTHVGWATSAALQPDGKILIAGQKDFDVSVLRLQADGTPDTSFGVSGYASMNLGSESLAADLLVQPDGKIVVSGEYDRGPNPLMFVARFTATGQPDSAFGGTGYIRPQWGYSEIDVNRIVLDANNRIVATGAAEFPNNEWDIFLTRFNPDGTWDTTFHSSGWVRYEDPDFEEALAMAIVDDGKILLAGIEDAVTAHQPIFLRINSSVAVVSTSTSTVPVVTPSALAAAPAVVSYRALNMKVTVRWGAVPGATSYVVTTAAGVEKCTTTSTSCSIPRLRNGKAYTYLVYAVNADGVRSSEATRVSVRAGFQVKKTSLKVRRSLALSSIVTTPSKGAKTWRVTSGKCRIDGVRLVAPATKGTCKVRVATAKSGTYAAMSTTITVTITK